MSEPQIFEARTWADAEVTKAEQSEAAPEQNEAQDDEQAAAPETDQEPL